jgi:hypothetical protein
MHVYSCIGMWKFPTFILYQQNMPCFSKAVSYLSFPLEFNLRKVHILLSEMHWNRRLVVKNMLSYNNTRNHILLPIYSKNVLPHIKHVEEFCISIFIFFYHDYSILILHKIFTRFDKWYFRFELWESTNIKALDQR